MGVGGLLVLNGSDGAKQLGNQPALCERRARPPESRKRKQEATRGQSSVGLKLSAFRLTGR